MKVFNIALVASLGAIIGVVGCAATPSCSAKLQQVVQTATVPASEPVTTQVQATEAKTEAVVKATEVKATEAKATEAKTEAKTVVSVSKTEYKGRAGATAFMEALSAGSLPDGYITVDATSAERVSAGLDRMASQYGTVAGRRNAAIALIVAANGAAMAGDLQEAEAATTVATYSAWTERATGIEEERVPDWHAPVLRRALSGNTDKTTAAIDRHHEAERRLERLKNPSWSDRLANWWYRE